MICDMRTGVGNVLMCIDLLDDIPHDDSTMSSTFESTTATVDVTTFEETTAIPERKHIETVAETTEAAKGQATASRSPEGAAKKESESEEEGAREYESPGAAAAVFYLHGSAEHS